MLTSQQKTFYGTFGFLVLEKLLTNDEVRLVEEDFEGVLAEVPVPENADEFDTTVDGRTIFKLGTQWFLARREDAIDKRPGFRAILDDERIRGSIEDLLGPGFYETGNTAKRFVGGTDWHSDLGWDPHFPKGRADPAWPEKGIGHYYGGLKAALYLQPLTKETGCLRVIPGSHQSPYHENLRSLHYQIPGRFENLMDDPDIPQFGLKLADVPSYAIESQPHDVVLFSHQIWHAAFGGTIGRRMITWDYKSKPECEHEQIYAEQYQSTHNID